VGYEGQELSAVVPRGPVVGLLQHDDAVAVLLVELPVRVGGVVQGAACAAGQQCQGEQGEELGHTHQGLPWSWWWVDRALLRGGSRWVGSLFGWLICGQLLYVAVPLAVFAVADALVAPCWEGHFCQSRQK